MANRLKKKTEKKDNPEKLNPDKEVQVTVEEVVKDERTKKILGVVALLLSIFLAIAFTSYFFTWQQDQDLVLTNGAKILISKIKVANLLGALGAYTAHTFIYNGFGIASYLFCIFFFMLGMNMLTGQRMFNLARNLRYMIAGLVVISMTAAFAAGNSIFSWGGAVGEMIEGWIETMFGKVGTGFIISAIALVYVIWRFNPSFKIPERKIKPVEQLNDAEESIPDFNEQWENELYIPKDESLITAKNEGSKDEDNFSGNKLKNNDGGITVIMPGNEDDDETGFEINEKFAEEMPPSLNEILPLIKDEINTETSSSTKKKKDAPALELEIKDSGDMDEEGDRVNGADKADEDDENDTDELPATGNRQPLTNYEPTLDLSNYKYPHLDLLESHGSEKIVHDADELEANKNQIINTLKNYDILIQRISATIGPTVTLYEIVPAPGVRISRIKNLEDDIALSLAALGIRIIAPIPGKGTIGIEVPNVRKTVVSMRTLLASDKFQNNNFSLPIAIGKKIDNENFIVDLASMPHLLMAGATGQGKSVGINTLLVSLLYKKHPSQLKLVLVDPKKVELSLYRAIERHFLAKLPGEEEPIITDTKKVVYTLNALCIEMDNRYDLLKEAGCRNLKEYNDKFVKRKLNPQRGHQFLPFIVLVIDEFADLIMTAGKEIEMPIARLAQLARAVGIHLIIATQRPSVNIITGTIKANFPARVAFKVSSKIDSRTILDTGGAEQLIGKGDMLVSYNGEVTRLQCAFVDTPEVEEVCNYIGDQQGYPQAFYLPEYVDEKEMEGKDFDLSERDSMFDEAARLIVQNQMGSTSLIQRRMKLGYNRAGRLMDQLEMAGIVGPNLGSKAREVLVKTDAELQQILNSL